MKITISGKPGSGKSTVAKWLAKKFGLKYYSVGDFRRKMAAKKGLTINELNKLGEKKDFTDKEADEWLKKIGKKDDVVIDARLGWYFVPDSTKIFLDVRPEVGAKRIFLQKRKTEKYKSMEDAIKANKERIKSDIFRYKKYYKINPYKKTNYDIIIDTTKLEKKEMKNFILNALKKRKIGIK